MCSLVEHNSCRNAAEDNKTTMLTDDARYRILKALEANPGISQRELADELGVSLGKINFCLKAQAAGSISVC